jgi:uncharacterized protein (TIGR00288 family)
MPDPNATISLAVFCDYENVAIGARDAKYDAFDIELVMERLLEKGRIVVKRAYADWDRYRAAKRPMHEASFELIEVPHVSYSGKNSADIRLVVDTLDLCHTKSHVDVFVIISGDSDFSPLVSKLRENDKSVIGIGVKGSSSALLIENCDEFIFYDDLVREKRAAARARPAKADRQKPGEPRREEPPREPTRADKLGDVQEAFDLVLDTLEALFKERDGGVYGSQVKQIIRRKRPHFDESYYGFRTFNLLLEAMGEHELLDVKRDDKSGGYVVVGFGAKA